MTSIANKPHPAAEWAVQQYFTPSDVDCTTTVVLKILDGKCKMSEGEKLYIMEIYDVAKLSPGSLFHSDTHELITRARNKFDTKVLNGIHARRLFAENNIPKMTMKTYKRMLREGLFG